MKIAIVAPEVFPVPPVRGGAVETTIEEVSGCLASHQVDIFSIADPALPRTERRGHRVYHRYQWSLLDRLLLSSWRLPFKQRRSRFYYRPYSRWAASAIAKLQPDLIWVHSRMPFVPWIRKAAPRARIIFSIHNESNLDGEAVWSDRAIGACDIVTGCSGFLTDAMSAQYPACAPKAAPLYNGVDVSAFSPWWRHTAERARLRQAHGLPAGPIILFVGRLVEVKGVHLLIEAVRRLHARGVPATLVIVGAHTFSDARTTPYIARLKADAAALGDRVRFAGHVSREDIHAYFLMSDMLAFSSVWKEPFGTVILEAMATGLPVVAFDQGGPLEILQHRRNGVLVPHADGAHGLMKALAELALNPAEAEALGRRARETAETAFTWQAMAEELLALDRRAQETRAQPAAHAPSRTRTAVLIAESGTGFGGTGKYLLELVSSLDRQRYQIHVVAAEEGPFVTQVRAEAVALACEPSWRFPWNRQAIDRAPAPLSYLLYGVCGAAQLLVMVPQIMRWLKRHRIALVHLNNEMLSHLPLILAARLAGCRLICHLHGWRALTRTERAIARLIDALICVSEAGAAFHSAQLRGRDVIAIPNGLRLNGHALALAAKRDPLRRRLGFGADTRVIAILGRLVPWKGHDVYLQALAHVRRRHPEVRGLIVGHDPEPGAPHLAKLRELAQMLGVDDAVTFLPWQEDVWAVYAACDAVVHASVEPEPFGLVILEAMAAGKPVIATRAGGVVDLVRDQETGLLVPPGDAGAMAEAIVRVCRDPALAARLADAAQHRATTVFTMERNAAQVAAVYERLLAPDSGAAANRSAR